MHIVSPKSMKLSQFTSGNDVAPWDYIYSHCFIHMYIQRKKKTEENFSLQLLCDLFACIQQITFNGQFHLFKHFLLLEVIATEFKHCLKSLPRHISLTFRIYDLPKMKMVFLTVNSGMEMNVKTLKDLTIHVYSCTLDWSAFCTNEVSDLA